MPGRQVPPRQRNEQIGRDPRDIRGRPQHKRLEAKNLAENPAVCDLSHTKEIPLYHISRPLANPAWQTGAVRSRAPPELQNTKSEARNPKQIQILKTQMTETTPPALR